jgi:hypothetical protein
MYLWLRTNILTFLQWKKTSTCVKAAFKQAPKGRNVSEIGRRLVIIACTETAKDGGADMYRKINNWTGCNHNHNNTKMMILILLLCTNNNNENKDYKNSHIRHCKHTFESNNVKVQNVFNMRNNITCSTNYIKWQYTRFVIYSCLFLIAHRNLSG